jgi:hypothetical protein
MSNMLDIQCATVLYAAAAAQVGIVVRTDNVIRARAALYRSRNALSDPELAAISIRVSPDDSEHELWILSNKDAVSVDLATV